MPKSKLDWKQYCCWVCDLHAISVHKFLKFITNFTPMVHNSLSLPTSMIDIFVWPILKSLDLKFYKWEVIYSALFDLYWE